MSTPRLRIHQMDAEVLATRKAGDYSVLTFAASEIAAAAKPGQFVTCSVGDPGTGLILRRAFSIHEATSRGAQGTIDLVVAAHGAGTSWLAQRRRYDKVNLVGPLGQGYRVPRDPVSCILVGGGYGSAPLFFLARVLAARGCRIEMILGAATAEKVFGILESRRAANSTILVTEDGSLGVTGRVTDVLGEAIKRADAQVVYACGPMGMLRAVADVADAHQVASQLAVEEAMACGFGVCMTCVLPIFDQAGESHLLRACVDGPVFGSHQIDWARTSTGQANLPTQIAQSPAVTIGQSA
jgi:dihydroorotate dehydrogenase electron transfer subunit